MFSDGCGIGLFFGNGNGASYNYTVSYGAGFGNGHQYGNDYGNSQNNGYFKGGLESNEGFHRGNGFDRYPYELIQMWR